MLQTIECIPNFSEGRDKRVLDELAAAALGVPGVTLADYSADIDHNRSVFTLIGVPDGVSEAVFQMCRIAALRIDLTGHSGAHPRMGAADVVPFVPLRGIEMAQCVALSKEFGRRIADELNIPVYLYGESAGAPHRKNLEKVRAGQFEGLADKMKDGRWLPDYGPARPHPTAGALAAGARGPLIAFNINLGTADVNIAKAIAKTVRASSGGYRSCKAIGIFMAERGIAQVSMNMVNCQDTPLYRVMEAVRFEAARWGVPITGSEIIGLTPANALAESAKYYLRLEDFSCERQILENYLDGPPLNFAEASL